MKPEYREVVIAKLELIVAKARVLAHDIKDERLWEGELGEGLSEILDEANQCAEMSREDR